MSTTQTTSTVGHSSESTIDAATFATQTTSATSSNSSNTNSTNSSTTNPSSTALRAGLGAGIPAALAIIGLIAFLFYRMGLRQNRQAPAQQHELDAKPPPSLPVSDHSDHFDSAQHNEALLKRPKVHYSGYEAEMAHQRSPVELEGRRMYEVPSRRSHLGQLRVVSVQARFRGFAVVGCIGALPLHQHILSLTTCTLSTRPSPPQAHVFKI